MKIIIFKRLVNYSDYHRLENPFYNMSLDTKNTIRFISSNEILTEDALMGIDIVIWSNDCPFKLDTVLTMRKKYKFKIVVDIDDNWENKSFNTASSITSSILQADTVFTTTQYLKEKLLVFNRNVYVVPNALPYKTSQFIQNRKTTINPDRLIMVYIANISHYNDLKSIEYALERCNMDESIKKSLIFNVAGVCRVTEELDKGWTKIENLSRKFGFCRMSPVLGIRNYMEHYDPGDFSISPLSNNENNLFKSNIKVLESGCKYLPIIVPAIGPYLEDKDMHNEGLFLCKTNKDWFYYIKRLANDKQLCLDMGMKLNLYVNQKYNFKSINETRNKLLSCM